MHKLLLLLLLFCNQVIYGQSKSVTHFRSDFKENSNVFFYSSTLKMLNPENNPEFAEILKDIDEIRVLNYSKPEQNFDFDDVAKLKQDLKDEGYDNLMMIRNKENGIDLFKREKRGKTVGFVAVVENDDTLVLIDLSGNIDMDKFMELKKKLDIQVQ